MLGAIPLLRSLDPSTDQTLLSFVLAAIMVLFVGTMMLPFRRTVASIDEAEFRLKRRSVASWILGRPPESEVVAVGEIQWVRVDRSPWGDGVILLQRRGGGRFRISIPRSNSKAVAFCETLLRVAGSTDQAEVRPNWWSTLHGRLTTIAIAVLGLAAVASTIFIDVDSELRGSVALAGLVLFGMSMHSLFFRRVD
ncbi:MAG: hypothetical protein JNK07_04205 [Alphaproteobacteria bacterium]|nr:hypothetical protein [Alphaproteobacteria bacterium]